MSKASEWIKAHPSLLLIGDQNDAIKRMAGTVTEHGWCRIAADGMVIVIPPHYAITAARWILETFKDK